MLIQFIIIRKTGWQPKGDIVRDEEGFEDIEQFFSEEHGQQFQPYQLNKPNKNNSFNSSIVSLNQTSKPLLKTKKSPAMKVMVRVQKVVGKTILTII